MNYFKFTKRFPAEKNITCLSGIKIFRKFPIILNCVIFVLVFSSCEEDELLPITRTPLQLSIEVAPFMVEGEVKTRGSYEESDFLTDDEIYVEATPNTEAGYHGSDYNCTYRYSNDQSGQLWQVKDNGIPIYVEDVTPPYNRYRYTVTSGVKEITLDQSLSSDFNSANYMEGTGSFNSSNQLSCQLKHVHARIEVYIKEGLGFAPDEFDSYMRSIPLKFKTKEGIDIIANRYEYGSELENVVFRAYIPEKSLPDYTKDAIFEIPDINDMSKTFKCAIYIIPLYLSSLKGGDILKVTATYHRNDLSIMYSGNDSVVVSIPTSPGSLRSNFQETEFRLIKKLKLVGGINNDDFEFIKKNMGHLTSIDLSEATIADSKKEIPKEAFKDFRKLTHFIFPQDITSIGKSAFSGCTGFTGSFTSSFTLPNNITEIGDSVFAGCTGFTGSLTLPNTITKIGKSAFAGCTGFTGCTFSNTITSIGSSAFARCTGFIGSLKLPNNITEIGDHAFFFCSNFTGSLTLPSTITKIDDYAFGYTGFTDPLILPNTITEIGNHAFVACRNLTGTLTIPNTITKIGNYAFAECTGFTGTLILPNTITEIGSYAFAVCTGFTDFILPNTLTEISEGVFIDCQGLTGTLTLPNTITKIGDYAFADCTGFTGTLTLPNTITSIGRSAFEFCIGFTGTLTLPNTITSIGRSAFELCEGFTGSLTLPNTITEIDKNAVDIPNIDEIYLSQKLFDYIIANNIAINTHIPPSMFQIVK